MQKRGSITIYAALALTVLITVLSGLIWSVKVQAGRMEAANAAEQALFSLLAHYDRELFADYGLLFVDGGCGTAELRLDACGDFLEDSMSFILRPNRERELLGGKNLLDLSLAELSFTGYTLATDLDGRILAEQAGSCMKDTGCRYLPLLRAERKRPGRTEKGQLSRRKSPMRAGRRYCRRSYGSGRRAFFSWPSRMRQQFLTAA